MNQPIACHPHERASDGAPCPARPPFTAMARPSSRQAAEPQGRGEEGLGHAFNSENP